MSKNTKTDPALLIERLLAYSLDNLSLKSENLTIVRNNLLDLFRLSEPGEPANEYGDLQRDILNPLIDYAVGAKLIKDIDALLFETRIMGLVTPMPSDVIDEFDCIASRQGIECATEFLYD
jgi:UDPglucose--hexose-1-phosphate uridylyltransferase